MPTTGILRLLRSFAALAVALAALTISGCGATEPEKNIKPGTGISAEAEAKLKEMQATAKPIKRAEDLEKEADSKTNGTKKGTKKAAAPAAPKGLIPMRR